ncbi:hypothetical protein BH11ACT8_BH11ACT8_27950 [soil metagenome]
MADPTVPPPPFGPPPYPPPPPYEPPATPRRSRVPLVLAIVLGVLVLGGGIALPFVLADDDPADRTETVGGTQIDLAAVEEYDEKALARDHVTTHVDYPQSPPVGGRHFRFWADCGVYEEPLPDEVAVHDLEHGTVWFAYDPDSLDAAELVTLAAALPQNGIMSPYDGLDAPVVLTVWGRRLSLTGVDDPRLALFLDAYAGGPTAPEPLASCAGGLQAADLDQVADELSGTQPA